MTAYHVNVNSAHVFFVRLIFVAVIDYENMFIMKIFRLTIFFIFYPIEFEVWWGADFDI